MRTIVVPWSARSLRMWSWRFARFCAENGWTPCFYGVSDELRTQLTEATWNSVQVAEETVLPLPGLEFRGKKWQDVRTALNKATNLGVTAESVRFPEAPTWMTDQIRALSRAWLADKGLPEMGFTLGRLE
ncbi:phosphatidylglycerol lysyltransferase domain-containing protein, partial [Kibdelosporangium lantanae]